MLTKKNNQWPQTSQTQGLDAENIIKIEQKHFQSVVDGICQQCRYPLLALRILVYVICSSDTQGRVYINARQLSRKLDVHYDTLTKCLKYLRETGILSLDQ